MQQAGMTVERKRVETMVETLAAVRGRGESLAEVAHDARNMVAALDLYCDLLDQPGVLGSTFAHYASELRLVAAASRKLVEKLVTLEAGGPQQLSLWRNGDSRNGDRTRGGRSLEPATIHPLAFARFSDPLPSQPVASLAAELHATRNLLAALAGPSIAVAVDIDGGALPVRITAEDLTRALVNLVKNAVEAMPDGGELRISLRENAERRRVTLSVEDSGPGILPEALELIFAAGYSSPLARISSQTIIQTRSQAAMAPHRGLGLSITRSIVEAAGGRIFAENRAQGGARIVMELPAGEKAGSRE
jgi:signal transduction histidine kinase